MNVCMRRLLYADCGRSFVQESTTAVIETGLCGHSRPTADICATMFQQLGVPLNLNESMPEPLMVGSRLCRDYLYHDDLAEKREVY